MNIVLFGKYFVIKIILMFLLNIAPLFLFSQVYNFNNDKSIVPLQHAYFTNTIGNRPIDYAIENGKKLYPKEMNFIEKFPPYFFAADTNSIKPIRIGDKLPDEILDLPLKVTNYLLNRDTVTIRELSTKKFLVLYVWAVSCKPCLKSMFKWEEIAKKIGEDITVVGLNVGHNYQAARYINEWRWSLPQILAPSSLIVREYFTPNMVWGINIWIKDGAYFGASSSSETDEYIYSLLRGDRKQIPDDVNAEKSVQYGYKLRTGKK